MKTESKKYVPLFVGAFLLFLAVHYWDRLSGFFGVFLDAASPLLVGCAAAFILNIPMCFYERHWFPGSKRTAVIKTRRIATMIGALIAFTALIPIAGAYIGAGIGAFMIMTVSPMKAVLFIVYIIVLQQLEGNIIYPRVVGSSIGLHGIWVLAAVTIGGGVMGIPGMLLGVPLAAALYRLLRDDINKGKPNRESEQEMAMF